MQPSEILTECEKSGVHLFFAENKIKAKGDFNVLDVALIDSLFSEKEAVTKCLMQMQNVSESVIVFSKVLGRDIIISWKNENPKVVYVDQTPYSLKEIKQLKSQQLSAKDLKNIHNIKAEFDGHVVEKTQ
ncbi:hypothetical protein HQ584_05160 [Patescibacteria group bacterium]|nr:hypothetical protein [Patescibacteria group bacterium]